MRYAIDASNVKRELGWVPQETFERVCVKPLSGTLLMRIGGSLSWMGLIRGSARALGELYALV